MKVAITISKENFTVDHFSVTSAFSYQRLDEYLARILTAFCVEDDDKLDMEGILTDERIVFEIQATTIDPKRNSVLHSTLVGKKGVTLEAIRRLVQIYAFSRLPGRLVSINVD